MRYFLLLSVFVLELSLFAQPEIALVEYAAGFTRPLAVEHANDDRIFVVEQDGAIKIVENGVVASTPFLNINPRVRSTGNEQGLLGLAFHPDYANNGYFFVNYINNSGDTQVSRFSVSTDDPNVADPDSELMILDADQPYSNHNGGCIKFGPDGYLYLGLGDGGSGGDPDGYGQNRLTFLGKMLRIDVNNSTEAEPYVVPATNPFVNDDNTFDEIWAIGMRNPWRFSFDKQTGDLWIGDVGQGSWEEIDFQAASSTGGENYGWRCYEGDHSYNTSNCEGINEYDFPVFEYPNSFTGGCSVTGGYVYRGTEFPALNGYYLFADYCAGEIISLYPDGTGGWNDANLLETNSFVSSFGEDAAGEMYMVDLFSGQVFKIVDACSAFAVTTTVVNENCAGQSNGMITLQVSNDANILWSSGSTDNPLTDLSADSYSATITSDGGCETTVNVDVESDHPALEAPELTDLNNTLSVPDVYATYQWYNEGGALVGENSSTYNFEENGSYFVIVTNENGCSVFSNILSVEFVNTLEALSISGLNVSPVPFENSFNLNIETTSAGDYQLNIMNANGEQVLSMEKQIGSSFQESIDMSDFPSGLYFLMIERDGLFYAKRLLKQ